MGVDDVPKTGSVTDTDDNFEDLFKGTFSYSNQVIRAGYGYKHSDKIGLGMSISSYSNEIDTFEGQGYGMDVGLIYNDLKNSELSLSVKNILPTTVEYTDSSDPSYSGEEELPIQAAVGFKRRIRHFGLFGQYKYDGVNGVVAGGLSYAPPVGLNRAVVLHAGYKEYSILDNIGNTYTAGISVRLFGFVLSYAYEKSDIFEFDNHSYFSLSYTLGRVKQR